MKPSPITTPVRSRTAISSRASATFRPTGFSDALNNIAKAEYSLDGGEWKVAAPVTRLSDAQELDYELNLDAAGGEHTIAVRVEDEYGNQAVEKTVVR